jgi:glutamate formiminotransferase / formiminotetrahydrofolate cyclodeaminase
VMIVGSEIVGLIPKRAIELTADFYLQLENFSPAQVLENRLEASLGGAAFEGRGKLQALAQPFLDAVAQPTATPGGGSVAALAGALGASLGQMVAGLSRKKKSHAAHVDRLSEAVAEFHTASRALAEAIDRDTASFESVMAAYKLPQSGGEEQQRRESAIQRGLESISSPSMLSDIRVGRLMAAAGVRGALENVAINLESITDAAFAGRMRSESASLLARVTESPVGVGRP